MILYYYQKQYGLPPNKSDKIKWYFDYVFILSLEKFYVYFFYEFELVCCVRVWYNSYRL